MAEIAFVRSPHAHAKITALDFTAALELPGVLKIYGGADVVQRIKPLVNSEELRVPPGIADLNPVVKIQPAPILAVDRDNRSPWLWRNLAI